MRNQVRSLGFSGDGSEIWLSGRVGNRLRLMPLMGELMGLVIKNGRVVKKAPNAKAAKATPAEAENAKKRTLFQRQIDASIAFLDDFEK